MASYLEGKPVFNSSRPMEIYITKEDVSFAKSKEPDACAAAVACLRNPGVQKALVHLSVTFIKTRGKWFRYRTPVGLRDEIVAFDRGGSFYPGDFKLLPVPVSMARHRSSGSRQSSSSAPKRIVHMVQGVREHASNTLQLKSPKKK